MEGFFFFNWGKMNAKMGKGKGDQPLGTEMAEEKREEERPTGRDREKEGEIGGGQGPFNKEVGNVHRWCS